MTQLLDPKEGVGPWTASEPGEVSRAASSLILQRKLLGVPEVSMRTPPPTPPCRVQQRFIIISTLQHSYVGVACVELQRRSKTSDQPSKIEQFIKPMLLILYAYERTPL